jgi:hypothetical protein
VFFVRFKILEKVQEVILCNYSRRKSWAIIVVAGGFLAVFKRYMASDNRVR